MPSRNGRKRTEMRNMPSSVLTNSFAAAHRETTLLLALSIGGPSLRHNDEVP
jgi:hypothetical protein